MKRILTNTILQIAIALTLAIFPLKTAYGQEATPEQKPCPCPCPSGSASVKVAQTVQDHLDIAESYKKKADQYRLEAQEHRKMKEDYKRRVPQNSKEALENPWLKKMRLHCDKFILEAESLAREADKFAEYHTLRAKELQGQ